MIYIHDICRHVLGLAQAVLIQRSIYGSSGDVLGELRSFDEQL